MKKLREGWFFLGLFLFAFLVQGVEATSLVETQSTPVDECADCHKKELHAWLRSDHAKSMAIANNRSVLGDFDNKSVEHYGQKAVFFISDGDYKVTISDDANSQTLPIKYTFGYFPLQQYLVETERGRLQVLPFAWDTRTKEKGGQRWYHNYGDEVIGPKDRLHWRQPLQNWNGMCADCHSEGLVRNYDKLRNRFDTQFDKINIGCRSCHGDQSSHANSNALNKNSPPTKYPKGKWLRAEDEKTAHWYGEKRDNRFMDNCFSCHSLRVPLTDGMSSETHYLNQFSPQFLGTPNYHADGQIKEEVYVYGSFLQSKMFAAGVNCLDCHDKHTTKLKIEGNGLCLQCHSPKIYNVKKHHQHKSDSSGAQCVNCHMTTNRYMGVDDRRDHSFKIPRPDLSKSFGAPNACTSCHQGKSNEWALSRLENWHGKAKVDSVNKQHLMMLNNGQMISTEEHLAIIADDELDAISRATAIQLLPVTTQLLTAESLKPLLLHQEPLIRLAATNISVLLPTKLKLQLITPLLTDKYKAVRVSAARSLIDHRVNLNDSSVFQQAFNEMDVAHEVSSWRGEGRLTQGITAYDSNNISAAEKAFKATIKIEPYFEAGYINLADLYRAQQRPLLEMSLLKQGLINLPESATINYAFGLYFVRQQKTENAIAYFRKALLLQPDDSQYAYTFILALDNIGKSDEALTKLKTLFPNYEDKSQLKQLGIYLSQKNNNKSDYYWFEKQ